MRKIIMAKFFILVCVFLAPIKGRSQDIHFSQFYHSSLFTNPANTGVFDGRYRISTNYRNQWQSINKPYKTVFTSFDMKFPSKKLGLGMSFFNDKAGKSKMGITQGNLLVSYNLRINGRNHFITGIQYGFGQKSISFENLKWDSQFNGNTYNPDTPSGENQASDSYTYMDVSAGVLWNYIASPSRPKFKASAGLAIFHANQPNQSFIGNDKLYLKIVSHINNQFKIPDREIYFLPQLLYAIQGPQSEINIGTLVKFVLLTEGNDLIRINRVERKNSYSYALVGAQLRYKDALIVMAAFEFKKGLLLSFSYDVNISKLNVASRYKGGMELALSYRGYF